MALPGSGVPRFLVLGPADQIDRISEKLLEALPQASSCTWSLFDIAAGIPTIGEATAGDFIPQMLDLESLGALSFTKGCYPGQEVVARLQYRGQLKRKLYRAVIETPEIPAPGTPLASPLTEESVGQVLASVRLDDSLILVQAVVVIERKDSADIYLGSASGPVLYFEPDWLPFDNSKETSHVH